ncbi:MAG: PfkB family carbohydrate kinase [Flaviflexus sp.]|nr:PfkB family carbohydrate kinase [Flaviflexus sp.]
MSNLVVGESLVDIFPDASLPGGSAFNVARALAGLGRLVKFATEIGGDERGELLREAVAEAGIDLIDGSITGRETSHAIANVNAAGEPTYEFSIRFCPPEPTEITPTPSVLHTGSLAVHINPERVLAWIDSVSSATVVYDPNYREETMGSMGDAVATCERFIRRADVVRASHDDLRGMYPDLDDDEVITRWLGLGPKLVAVTNGAAGAVLATAKRRIESRTPRVAVVDKVGAGDAFTAALIDALGRCAVTGADSRDQLGELSERQLRTIGGYANAGAAITVSYQGAVMPSREELLDHVEAFATT